MSQRLLGDARLFEQLFRFDEDLANEARRGGCACGGRLHSARFPRKPRGGPPIEHERIGDPRKKRLSFCCDREGCRRRTTPPSLRFLGRRVYLAATVVLVSAMKGGITPRRAARLRELCGVTRRTLERWRVWWQEAFAATDLWRARRVWFAPPADETSFPRALLVRFGAFGTRSGLVGMLRFLSPLGASEHVRRGAIAGPQRM